MNMERVILLCLIVSLSSVHGVTDYENSGLSRHNAYRMNHRVSPASLDGVLNSNAQRCANHYASKGTIDHSCPFKSGAGENLYSSGWTRRSGSSCAKLTVDATTAFYNEIKYYDFRRPTGWSPKTGHFTQLIWKTATKVGFGCAIRSKKAYIVVLYKDHGNLLGPRNDLALYFRQNVFPKR